MRITKPSALQQFSLPELFSYLYSFPAGSGCRMLTCPSVSRNLPSAVAFPNAPGQALQHQ